MFARPEALWLMPAAVLPFLVLVLRRSLVDLPPAQLGLLVCSKTPAIVPNPGGSAGNLCLGGAIGRYGQIVQVAADGTMTSTVDLTQTPQPTGLVAIAAGETWRFQAWHRDGGTSNLTVGLEIPFD